jgi:hypothetical protein
LPDAQLLLVTSWQLPRASEHAASEPQAAGHERPDSQQASHDAQTPPEQYRPVPHCESTEHARQQTRVDGPSQRPVDVTPLHPVAKPQVPPELMHGRSSYGMQHCVELGPGHSCATYFPLHGV